MIPTNFTQQEHQFMIALLQEARKEIDKRSTAYVCIAISKAALSLSQNSSKDSSAQAWAMAKALISWIEDSLRTSQGTFPSVVLWLGETHNIFLSRAEALRYRLAWIDQMIALLSSPD